MMAFILKRWFYGRQDSKTLPILLVCRLPLFPLFGGEKPVHDDGLVIFTHTYFDN